MIIQKTIVRKDANYYGIYPPLSFLFLMLLFNGFWGVATASVILYLSLKKLCF